MSGKVGKIEGLANKGKASKLVKYAFSKDVSERIAAVTGMGKCTITEDAYNALLDALRDTDIDVRIGAVKSLQAQNQRNAVEHIRHAYNDQSDPRLIAACKDASLTLSDYKHQ